MSYTALLPNREGKNIAMHCIMESFVCVFVGVILVSHSEVYTPGYLCNARSQLFLKKKNVHKNWNV